jgi:arabinofuranosyltransferase
MTAFRRFRALHLCAALAVILFSGLFWAAGWRSSVIVDGTRYHYLDDDQMISMRYARNLAEGHGPVWNAGGERVEGYTNAGWMLVMAGVHRLGAPDRSAAFWVRTINWALGCAVLLLAARLLETLDITDALPVFAALTALALSIDLLFWAINGFETTLLTALFLWCVLRALDDGARGQLSGWTCLLAGLLPIVRADAIDLTAAVIITAVVLGARRRWWLVAFAILPFLGHELFRVTYYGDWLPNTYYLKVAGRTGLFWAGLGNTKGFFAIYTVALIFAAGVSAATTDRRLRVLASLIGLGFARLLFVGPDIFPGYRFLAPYIPLLLIVAAAAVRLPREPVLRWTMALVLLAGTVFNAGVSGRVGLQDLASINGLPAINTVTGVLLNRYARPQATVVVVAAGCLPYFSRLGAVDLLGKSDRHVARVAPTTPGRTGHNRFDVDWSLRTRPDFVAVFSSFALVSQMEAAAAAAAAGPAADFGTALLLNPTFIREYRQQPIPLPLLLERNALFVDAQSVEHARLSGWRAPVVEWQ